MTMEQTLQAVSRDDVLAAIEQQGGHIPPGDRFTCLFNGHRYDPKALMASALQLTTGQVILEQTLADATYAPFEQALRELEFCVVKIPRSLGDESLTAMVYEIKKPDIVQSNYSRLLSGNQKRFYWNQDKFEKLKKGSPVFVVNSSLGKVLYGYLHTTHIKATYQPEKDTSVFTDQGETFEVRGQWHEFVALDIRHIEHVPRHWKWKTLGSGEHTYLSGPEASTNSARNNLERVNLLLEVFSDEHSDVGLQLHTCYGALTELLPAETPVQAAEPAIWFVMQGKTFGRTYLWAPLKDRRGLYPKHWAAMNELKVGDIVVHNSSWGIKGISRVVSAPYKAPVPYDDDDWQGDGIKADVDLQVLIEPEIKADTLRRLQGPLAAALSDVRGPFNVQGTGNQGYLFEFTWEALAILLADRVLALPDSIKQWLPAVDVKQLEQAAVQQPDVANDNVEQRHTEHHAKDWLQTVQANMAAQGFHYSLDEVANFYLCLRTKPLVLLAGISGTGKTQLVKQFAKAIGYGDADHCVLIPVRPDWADSTDLVGYENIQGKYVDRPFLNVLQRAMAHPNEPYFVILDEMNLARVEHYFAEFLSIIETRQRNANSKIVTDAVLNRADVNDGVPVVIPQNLFVVGTVNMDETTHPFSRKVLDRANAIEMNDIDLAWVSGQQATSNLTGIYADALVSPYLTANDLSDEQKQRLTQTMNLLTKINQILEPAGLHVGYRVRDEMAFYLTLHAEDNLTSMGFSEASALDFQIMQKILPRIQGSSMAVYTAMIQLLNQLSGVQVSVDTDIGEIQNKVNASGHAFSRSVKKLMFMLQRFNNDGFTSFWL